MPRPLHRLRTALLLALVTSSSTALPAPAQDLPVCQLIATGGTIAMKVDPVTQAPIPALSGEDLRASVPELATVATIRVASPFNIPSYQMDPERWLSIRNAALEALADKAVSGVIISHGTDTMEETAYFLDLTVSTDKPIVLVGAQRNASERDFDGPRNLLNASRICVAPEARGKGVMIALNNQISAARDATKASTSNVETFQSPESGFLGVVDQDRVVFQRAPTRRQHVALGETPLPRVDIVPVYAGADGSLLRAAVVAGAKGAVIQAFGLGNVPIPVFEAVKAAIEQGVVVAISTRVPTGRVLPVYGPPGGGRSLKDAGAVFADNLSPQKARILLMLAIQGGLAPGDVQRLFDR